MGCAIIKPKSQMSVYPGLPTSLLDDEPDGVLTMKSS